MSNVTAEAPVRANKAPPRARAARNAPQDTEATLLVRQVAKYINDLLIPISGNWPWDLSLIPGREFIDSADTQLHALGKRDDEWGKEDDEPPRPAMPEHLAQIADDLRSAMKALSAPTGQPGQLLVLRLLVDSACDLVEQLQAAHAGLPGTMDDLRALATFAGVRHHREQPRPPIRRTPEDELTVAQYKVVLEQIAGHCITLKALLANSNACETAYISGVMMDSATIISSTIGGMADAAVGGGINGGHDGFQYGHTLREAGKEGAA